MADLNNPSFAKDTDFGLRGELKDIRLMAQGGMSLVFSARQPSLDRLVIIKKLKDDLFRNVEMTERFRREAKALASLIHQNVVHVYDYVETPREAYLIMEYIEGVDLSFVLEKLGPLPWQIAALILRNVAQGLDCLHKRSIIHRDVKPSNVRLTNRGEVKLMDFGIAYELDSTSLTRPGFMVGSPSYLSPEQVLGDPLSHLSDIFLLGICFYEMLTGVRPFREEEGESVFQRIREAKYVPIRSMNSKIPAAVAQIVESCLEARPGNRPQSCKSVVEALESVLGSSYCLNSEGRVLTFLDEEALVQPAMQVAELKAWKRKFSWKRFLPTLIAALCLVGAGFAAGYYKSKPQPVIQIEGTTKKPLFKR